MSNMSKEEAAQWFAQNRGLYKKLSEKISNILHELLEEGNITIHAITNRTKEIDSFKNKVDNPKYDDPVSQITDLSGIRIIAYVENDLKSICNIVEDAFDIDKENSADKSMDLGTDKVGYKSIHYIGKIKSDRLELTEYKKFKNLKFEIQIRTILQHAWAEIEHDRNYKFNGVLPPEIKRRFKILAGCLELLDKEFNSIASDIDKTSKDVSIADKKNDLKEIAINSTTLKSYLAKQFSYFVDSGLILPNFNNKDSQIIDELHAFGVDTLNDLKEIIADDFHKNLKNAGMEKALPGNYLGLLRNIMLANNPDKYFTNSWKKDWHGFNEGGKKLLTKYIDLSKIISTYLS